MPRCYKVVGKIGETVGIEIQYEQCSQCGKSLMKNMPKLFEMNYEPREIAATLANVPLSMLFETPVHN